MGINALDTVSTNIATTYTKAVNNESKDSTNESSKTTGFSDVAAVYDKASKPEGDAVTNKKTDRDALIQMMKDDQERLKNNLFSMIKDSMTGQALATSVASNDASMWKLIASGNFSASAEDIAQAKKDIADDGYWGVDKTSSRIVDFAIGLSGGDAKQADKLLSAFEKGFEQATGAWGKKLPDISSKTYDAVHEKFDAWKNGTYKSSNEDVQNLLSTEA